MLLVPVLVLALMGRAWAVFREDAFRLDWKLSTVGAPSVVCDFGNKSMVFITESGTLTALSSEGFALWRKVVGREQVSAGLAVVGDVAVLGGEALHGFNATSGELLWKVDHAAASVWTDKPTKQAIIDGKYTVSEQGTVSELHTTVKGQPAKVDGRAELEAGILLWDKFGVMRLEDGFSPEPLWVRNEGLSSAVDAMFVPAGGDVKEEREEILDDYFEYIDPSISGLQLWTARVMRHLGQIKDLAITVVRRGPALLLLPSFDEKLFGFDQLLVIVTESGSVYALDVGDDGIVVWTYHDLDAIALERDNEHADRFKVIGKEATYAMSFDGIILGLTEREKKTPVSSVVTKDSASGVQLSSDLFGWSLTLPGTTLVGSANRDPLDVSASIGVVIEDSHVRYKYLNPNAAAYATYSPSTKELFVTLVDTVSGRVLVSSTHPDPVVINEQWPFNIVYGEHWIVYTYLSQDPTGAPKITVWDLFESRDIDTRATTAEVDELSDTLLPSVVKHTWISPSRGEPVYAIGLSRTAHGAVVREIILALEHQVVALPKWLLSPLYPPSEIQVPQSSHLSHVYGVSKASKIVTSPTKVDSTYFIAALGGADVFFTMSSPSGEIDLLGRSFPRVKLIIFIAALGFATTTMAPLARRKILEAQWR